MSLTTSPQVRGTGKPPTKILVLNPNSSQHMTDGMKNVIDSLNLASSTEITTYTAPSPSPPSIDDAPTISKSTQVVLSDLIEEERCPPGLPATLPATLPPTLPYKSRYHLRPQYAQYDAILIACFSVHPLVRELSSVRLPGGSGHRPVITGIFESSILTALSLLSPSPPSSSSLLPEEETEKWGIVTTGSFWESHLTDGVSEFLGLGTTGGSSNSRFAGVQSTGLNAGDFHKGVSKEEIEARLKGATKKLLQGGKTTVVVMGCAGMAGLEGIIRRAAEEELGKEFAYGRLHVVDGVTAGVLGAEQTVRFARMRPGVGGE